MPDKPRPNEGEWGEWYCPNIRCNRQYCQDCGEELDYNDECPRYYQSAVPESA